MDLADRYLNCLATKALFRAGECEEGERVVSIFTRDGEQANNLYDMQATWYEISAGRAYLARKEYGRALKRFLKIDTHFADFVEDQFDFHQYCLRKQTMRVYVEMLRMEDGLYRHPVYAKAVAGAVEAYLALNDDPVGTPEEQEAAKVAAMSPEEAKKYLQKKKKEEAKKAKEEAAAAAAAATGGKKGQDGNKKVDPDPDGVALAATKDPLGEATKLIKRLESAAADRLDTQLLAFEVYSRKGRLLLALGAVKKALAIAGAKDPKVHVATVQLANLVQRRAAQNDGGVAAPGAAGEVLKEELAALLGGGASDAAAFAASWAQQHAEKSLAHSVAAARSTVALQPEKKAAAAGEVAKGGPRGAGHVECVEVHSWLSDGVKEVDAAAEFAAACRKVFRWSRYFGGDLCVPLVEAANGAHSGVEGAAEGVKNVQLDSS